MTRVVHTSGQDPRGAFCRPHPISLLACATLLFSAAVQAQEPDSAQAPQVQTSGTFSILTYNVAGLPPPVSKSSPIRNTPRISPLLNDYDLVLVQEDFYFHRLLAFLAQHPYQSQPHAGSIFSDGFLGRFSGLPYTDSDILARMLPNDGLNRFSRFPFTELERHAWTECSGLQDKSNDCLATKGFSFARHELAPGATIDVYNLHMDAGRRDDDDAARQSQLAQLRSFIDLRSAGNAVIIGGDTNLQAPIPGDEVILLSFLEATGFEIAARTVGQADIIDRFFYRSGTTLTLTPTARNLETERFSPGGTPLSDHDPVRVDFSWTLKAPEPVPPQRPPPSL